jgi:hypothetical protein
VDVHRPGQRHIAAGAEFAPGHEHDVGDARQTPDRRGVEEVAGDRLDAGALQRRPRLGFGEPGDADHPLRGRGTPGKARQGRAHLAADPEHENISVHG